MMEVPQLHGFGPAADRLLEAYKMLLKVFHFDLMICLSLILCLLFT